MLDVTQTIRDLPGISELHVVEEGNECKELLAIVIDRKDDRQPQIVIDRLVKGELTEFRFSPTEERECIPAPRLGRLPQEGEYLLEPSAAIMKAAPFNLLAQRFASPVLHPNTHLYVYPSGIEGTIPDAVKSFPGTVYKIEQSLPLTSSNLKLIGRTLPQADIAVRNLKGFTPDTLRKRLKTKPGGKSKLYAVTVATDEGDIPALLVVSPA